MSRYFNDLQQDISLSDFIPLFQKFLRLGNWTWNFKSKHPSLILGMFYQRQITKPAFRIKPKGFKKNVPDAVVQMHVRIQNSGNLIAVFLDKGGQPKEFGFRVKTWIDKNRFF